MKYFIVLLLLLSSIAKSGVLDISVGPLDDIDCNYHTIQDALDAVSIVPKNIRLVEGSYPGGLQISPNDNTQSLIGGFENCAMANAQIRTENTFSTIDGNGSDTIYLHNFALDPFEIDMVGLRITGGINDNLVTGGLVVVGNVSVELLESQIDQNEGQSGGGIYAIGESNLVLIDTKIMNNNVSDYGGGIYCNGCNISLLDNSKVNSNTAGLDGGGIYGLNESDIGLYGLDIMGNATERIEVKYNQASTGGGLYMDNSDVFATAFEISHNKASIQGAGAKLIEASSFTAFAGNGCLYSTRSKCNLFSNNIINNGIAGGGSGGAIYSDKSKLFIKNTWFEDNHAGGDLNGIGSAITLRNNGTAPASYVLNSVFFNNGIFGKADGYDKETIQVFEADLDLTNNTMVDNLSNDAVINVLGITNPTLNLNNSVIHNQNGADVINTAGLSPLINVDCVVVHEQASFSGSNVYVGEPLFANRSTGDLRPTVASEITTDICSDNAINETTDIELNPRKVDIQFINNEANSEITDAGAFELQDNDIIFVNGFDPAI